MTNLFYGDLFYFLPIFTVLLGAITLLIMSMYSKFSIDNFIAVSVTFLIFALGFSIADFGELYSKNLYSDILNGALKFDSFSNFFTLLLISGTILTILIGSSYFKSNKYFKGEFFCIMMLSLFGMILLAHSNELITAFIALEIASFAVYIMVGFDTNNSKRVEAIFKYLVLGSFIGAFYLLGTVLIFGATGTTNLTEISSFITNQSSDNLALIYIGITLILFTFLFKIAASPFHSWVLDIYRGAPMLVTAYMASTFKIAIFSFFLRAFLQDFASMIDFWDTIISVLAIVTLLFGTWLALTQSIVKKMLAASSIVHTGYLLIAFLALGQNIASAYSIMFYLIAYLLSAVGAFGLIAHISSDTKARVTYSDFKGLAKERPYLALCMTIFLLSLAGIPSTIGFIGKFYVFTEAIKAGFIGLTLVAIVATIVSVYYYFRLIAMMYFFPTNSNCETKEFNCKQVSSYVIAFIAILILWGGIGSAVISFVEIPSIDSIVEVSKTAIDSLLIK